MPNIMIHEEVGYYISKKININSYDYFLGLLAPDSPNVDGFAEKDKRWNAHVRKKDLNEWRQSLKKFYEKEKDNYNKDFILGYYIHILTDIVYDDFLYLKVRENILKDNYQLEESHQAMTNDMNNYYFNEIEEIKEILANSKKSYDIRNIDKDTLTRWKEKQIKNFTNKNTSKYITKNIVEELNKLVYNELIL